MQTRTVVCAVLVLAPVLSAASDVTITSNNSTLKVTAGDTANFHLPQAMEWTVDGRKIVVYPASPWNFTDVTHFHPDETRAMPRTMRSPTRPTRPRGCGGSSRSTASIRC